MANKSKFVKSAEGAKFVPITNRDSHAKNVVVDISVLMVDGSIHAKSVEGKGYANMVNEKHYVYNAGVDHSANIISQSSYVKGVVEVVHFVNTTKLGTNAGTVEVDHFVNTTIKRDIARYAREQRYASIIS